ncbi:hypothetical protein ANO14919_086440 [Xylariales sp. No.14919]|nr:hypothetical protein ANO14919_086440 [Xylariales sp. No.14919]
MAGKQRFFGLRGTNLQRAIALVSGIDLLLFGYDQGVMGGLLTLPSFTATFPEICTNPSCIADMTASQKSHRSLAQGIAVSSYNLGCFAGALLTVIIGDRLGRRRCIFLGSVIMVIGAILQASAFSLAHLVVGRLICGIGNGINTSTVPVWQVECSKPHRKGQAIVFELSIVILGVALSYWIDFGFSFLDPSSAAWRAPIAIQLLFSIFVASVVLTMPESPRYLILKDRDDEALEVLSAINGLPADDVELQVQLRSVKATTAASAQGSYRDLFTMGRTKNFQRTALAYGIQVMQQVTGINLITYYAATIYQNDVGLSGFLSRILAAANGTEYFLATIPTIFLVEKCGRRPLLFVGSTGMAISMIILTVTTSIGSAQSGIAAATFLFVFNTFFAIGWVSLPWLMPSELVPVGIRAQANALSTSANWIFNFLVVMITPVAFAMIGPKAYIIFAVFNAVSIPIVYFCYPETAYRSLEEIDLIFAKSTGVYDAVKVAKSMPNHFGKHGEVLIDMLPEVEHEIALTDKSEKVYEVKHVEPKE